MKTALASHRVFMSAGSKVCPRQSVEGTLKGMPIGLDLPRLVMGWFFDN